MPPTHSAIGSPCGAVLVPAPNPIPLRRLEVRARAGCRSRHRAVRAASMPPTPTPLLRPAVRAAAAARPSSISRRASTPSGSSRLHRLLPGAWAIATGAGTAGTIPSAAASAISSTANGVVRMLARLAGVAARPMQRDGGGVRDVEARQRALRRDAADQVAMLPRELAQAFALGAEHERERARAAKRSRAARRLPRPGPLAERRARRAPPGFAPDS